MDVFRVYDSRILKNQSLNAQYFEMNDYFICAKARLNDAVVPENTTSLIYVPVLPSKDFTIYANDKKIWEGGKFIDANNKISYDSKSGDFIVF